MRRRTFLALAAPALVLPHTARALADRRPLRRLPVNEGRLVDGVRIFDLAVAEGETEFLAGRATPTLGVNRSYLGETLRLAPGERVRMNVLNDIFEPIALHWHGMHLPSKMDGGPHQEVAPGSTWSPEWEVRNAPGTYWYHGHQMARTGEHVWRGMAGVLRVDGEAPPGLPSEDGVDDFTLVLQDRLFDGDGAMPYAPNMHHMMAGYTGDRGVVNGTLDAMLEVPRGTVRLRLLNASNGSFYVLSFDRPLLMTQIASDGGLLPAPMPNTALLLGPAERAEVLVDFTDDRPAMLRADVFDAESGAGGVTWPLDLVEIRPVLADRGLRPAPARLADLPEPPPEAEAPVRDMELAMVRGMGGMGGGMSGGGMMGMSFSINGAMMEMGRIDFTVAAGAAETWRVRNTSPMFHTFHVHDVQFRVVARNGGPPMPGEAGWKDTIVTRPNETVDIRIRFGDYADPVLPYMYHCHILEHEDAGMMGQFCVV